MTNETNQPSKPRYVWPWFVLAAVLLGIVAAVVWVSAEVRRTKQRRDFTFPAAGTNSASPRPATR